MFKDVRVINFTKIFAGNSIGQLLALLLYPYIARSYAPEDFSKFGFIFSFVSILAVFGTGQFHAAFFNPETEDEVDKLYGLSIFSILSFSILALIGFLVFRRDLLVIPVYLFLYGVFDIQRVFLIRKKAYSDIFLNQILFRGFGNGGKLLPIMINQKYFGLVLSEILSLVLLLIINLYKFPVKIAWNYELFKKYKSFPFYHTLTMGTYILLNDFPILVWSMTYNKSELGFYVVAQRLMIMPVQVIGAAIQNSIIHHFVKSKNPYTQLFKISSWLFLLGIFTTLFFVLFGNQLMTLVLGANWRGGEEVFVWISFVFGPKLVLSLTQAVLVLRNSSKLVLSVRSIQIIILLVLTSLKLDFMTAFKSFILIDISADILLSIIAFKLIKPPFVFRSMEN